MQQRRRLTRTKHDGTTIEKKQSLTEEEERKEVTNWEGSSEGWRENTAESLKQIGSRRRSSHVGLAFI